MLEIDFVKMLDPCCKRALRAYKSSQIGERSDGFVHTARLEFPWKLPRYLTGKMSHRIQRPVQRRKEDTRSLPGLSRNSSPR